MKKSVNFMRDVMKRVILISVLIGFAILMCSAAPNTKQLDVVVDWISVWAGRIGLVVAFFGGIQTALSFKNDDADGKVRGLKTLVSGFMVYGISNSLGLFGL